MSDYDILFFESLGFSSSTKPGAAVSSEPPARQGYAPDDSSLDNETAILPGSPAYAKMIHETSPGDDGSEGAEDSDDFNDTDQQEEQEQVFNLQGLNMNYLDKAAVENASKEFGLNPTQARQLVEWQQKRETRQAEDQKRDCERDLKAQWGADGYTQKIQKAQATAQRLDRKLGGDLMPLLEGGAGNDPKVIKMLLKLSDML